MAAPAIFLFRAKPKKLPSVTAYKDQKAPKEFLKTFLRLAKIPNFYFIMLGFGFSYGVYATLGTTVGKITDEFDFTSDDTSIFGGLFIIFGVIGSFIHAIYLDRYKRFKKQFLIIILASIITYAALVFGLSTHITWLTGILLAFFGLSVIPVISVGYSFTAI